ncbi:ATP-dependent nuclease [Burkholderia cepacia]|uniref:ATP-dependent nuclease n=1 Tax=Burkholderia cepacia TaxID=292 RepID=UPI001CF3A8B4|nr:AAA family ATPase [Burkholderia cepacia]MCA8355049.1 AAA family ATPase [Burkholderia cepacia]
MHISKLTLINYRNFANATLRFSKGVNTVIGENGAGKTNVLRAIRLMLDDNMVRASYKLNEMDFHRGLGSWRGHWIIISLEFEEISADESIQALFVHGTGVGQADGVVGRATYNLIFRPNKQIRMNLAALADFDAAGMNAILDQVTIDDYETLFTGRSVADFADPAVYRRIAGDFSNAVFSNEVEFPELGARIPGTLSVTKEVSFTFIQALRDVVSEFHNNRTNPLLTLLKSKSGQIDPLQFQPIVERARQLNREIENLNDVRTVRSDIVDTVHGAAGQTYSPSVLAIKSDLPDEADLLFQSLKLFVGEFDAAHEGSIQELSLGGANLIFLTLKLLEFKYQHERQALANFLLIEEPEAHLHTHVQKTLFDRIGYAGAQIIYSTHSTHISAVSNIQSVNILGRNGTACEAFQPSTGLAPEQAGNLQRYLDAVRSNLLFAKSVLLVEGDAEEILIPLMVKKVLGVTLDELGVSLVNIGSTGFTNVSVLFHESRVRRRCSIITDLDAAFMNPHPVPGDDPETLKFKSKLLGSQTSGAARKVALDALVADNAWVRPFYAANTFEVDFVACGNVGPVVASVNDVYSQPATRAESIAQLTSGDPAQFGRRVLTMANYEGKGWFAILLGKRIDHRTVIPPYIRQAIIFAHGTFSTELIFSILKHRVAVINPGGAATPPALQHYWERLLEYRAGRIDFNTIRAEAAVGLPGDQILAFLGDLP